MLKKEYGPERQGKKLSWLYRNKKKLGKLKKAESTEDDTNNVQIQNKKARIVVRNLPFKTTEADIKKHYKSYGEIEEINLLRHPDGRLVGCGFVQFKRIEDASKAIFNTNKKEFLGRIIGSEWSIPKNKFNEKLKKDAKDKSITDSEQNTEDSVQQTDANSKKDDSLSKKKTSDFKKNNRKIQKLKKTKKRAKIIVRNLSFQATEDTLKEHFSQYGNIEDIKILTRPDGKRVGCGFIQYAIVQSAAKAIHHANLKPLLGRPVIVDWAVPKNKFVKDSTKQNVNGTNLNETEANKKENDSVKSKNDEKVEEESDIVVSDDSDEDEDVEIKQEEMSSEDEKSNASIKEEEEEEEEELDYKDNDASIEEESKIFSHSRPVINDVDEGKTVFLKNVPFSAKNEDLRQCMEQFGPVQYAVICIDPLMEHSRGTGFVKFKNIEDAEKCLSAGTELRLHDQVLDPHKALNKNEIKNKNDSKESKIKDSRNLFLVKEGVILAGSPAATDVSATDMAKRLQLEQLKSQMLRNLNMFVSRVRLVIHNLPLTLDDAKLRQIFINHSGPKAKITEARVMRDLRNIGANGIGMSKQHGFVTFTSHEDALKALRGINNNPNIFSKTKRPIVAFSIENRVMVNAKKRRIEKSREHNPLWPGNKTKSKEPPAKRTKIVKSSNTDDVQSYSGVTSKHGETKMRSKFNLKTQAALHNQVLKKEKKKINSAKKFQQQKRKETMARKEIKPKQGTTKVHQDDVKFNELVNNYKNKLTAVSQTKTKWYET